MEETEPIEEPLTVEDMEVFCRACSWVREVWCVHRAFQDNLPTDSHLRHRHGYLLYRLSLITQEYVLLQISKLHDPMGCGDRITIGFDLILRRGRWDDVTRAELQRIHSELQGLGGVAKNARNKIIAHNDRRTAIAEGCLGAFSPGLDDKYLQLLQEFVSLLYEKTVGGPYPFDDFATVDTQNLISDLSRLAKAGSREGVGVARGGV